MWIRILITAIVLMFVNGSSQTAAGRLSVGKSLPPDKAQPVRVARFQSAPTIDGKLDDEVWTRAAVLKNFYQVQPGDNIKPSQPTEVLLGYDARTFYIGFRAFDDPREVRATVGKRDDIHNDDNLVIYLDTFNDQRRAYKLNFNPFGIQMDSIYTAATASSDYSVDIVMQSKGTLTGDGYEVEVAIPFKSLRYEAGRGRLWGLQVFRYVKHVNNEQSSWMPLSRGKTNLLAQEGFITGLEDISTERTLEIIPSLTVSEAGKRVRTIPRAEISTNPALRDDGRFVNQPIEFDAGVTAKFSITSSITLNLAVKPDFAQVEADQVVVTANQRFPIFYQEKRPFFQEGVDIFQTVNYASITPVHTRAIVDPDVAVKLTGKRGRNSFGLLLASDNGPGNFSDEERSDSTIRPVIDRFIDKNAYIGVLRLKRDLGTASSIGFLATSYNFIEKHNQLGGLDGLFQLDSQSTLTFQALGTTSRRLFYDADLDSTIYRTGNGLRYFAQYNRISRLLNLSFLGYGQTQDYRADVGFTTRTNLNNLNSLITYNSEPKLDSKLISWSLENLGYIQYDFQGRMRHYTESPLLTLNFRRQTYLKVRPYFEYERIAEEEFGPKRTAARRGAFAGNDPERSSYSRSLVMEAGSTPSKTYSGSLQVGYSEGDLDFDFGAGPKFPRVSPTALIDSRAPLDPGRGGTFFGQAALVFQPTDALRMSLDYNKSRLRRYDTRLVAYDSNIYSLRALYQFSPFTFARARMDYDSISANFRGQFLFGWTPNPGTSLYVGYNDDLNRNGFSPFTQHFEPGLRRNGRTFFIKMSYLFRRSL